MFTKHPSRNRRPAASHAEAVQHVEEGGVAIYWRPGCPFCGMLERGLGPEAERAAWTNIWEDQEALAFVESLNDGNATVPTVVTLTEHFVAASPAKVAAAKGLIAEAGKVL
ncbi:glutaredoxin domain-containing protein [Kocuria nitroreducens]|uniref:glutaredoxin domain-containing protein n=1 Tax=Kocuria nitroreducens TaxID=3058914 RepID=UPI0036DE7550